MIPRRPVLSGHVSLTKQACKSMEHGCKKALTKIVRWVKPNMSSIKQIHDDCASEAPPGDVRKLHPPAQFENFDASSHHLSLAKATTANGGRMLFENIQSRESGSSDKVRRKV